MHMATHPILTTWHPVWRPTSIRHFQRFMGYGSIWKGYRRRSPFKFELADCCSMFCSLYIQSHIFNVCTGQLLPPSSRYNSYHSPILSQGSWMGLFLFRLSVSEGELFTHIGLLGLCVRNQLATILILQSRGVMHLTLKYRERIAEEPHSLFSFVSAAMPIKIQNCVCRHSKRNWWC
jgi:hypothetical protein